jgi:hypothetical protein
VWLILLLLRLRWRILLFASGFVWERGKGSLTVYWDDVRYFRELRLMMGNLKGIEMDQVVHLQLESGRKLNLDGTFRQIGSLAQQIRERTVPILYAKAAAQLQRGEPVSFEELQMYPDGLAKGNKRILWEEIQAVKIVNWGGRGYRLVVRKAGAKRDWYMQAFARFPNSSVFLKLVSDHIKDKPACPGEK